MSTAEITRSGNDRLTSLPCGKPHAMFAGALPQAKISRIAGQGHLAHARAPDVLAKHITDAVH